MKLCSLVLRAGLPAMVSLGLANPRAFGADLKSAVVEKGIQYVQSDTGTPAADLNNGVIFNAEVKAMGSNLISSASLTLPNGTSADVPADAANEFKLKKKFNKQTGVDGSFPNGTYTLTITAVHDGTKTFTLPLSGDVYPNAPHCTTFTGAQTLDTGAYFLFAWDPMAGGGPDDFVQLHIEDSQGNKVYETPDLAELNALDGRAVSALVPPGSLPPGQILNGYIYFKRAVSRDVTTDPGGLAFSDYYKRTKFTVQTLGTATSSDVKMYSVSKTRRFQQQDSGAPVLQPTKTYTLDVLAEGAKAGSVTSSSVTLPRGIPESLALQSDNRTFDYSDYNVNEATFETLYPSGTYSFKITTASGVKTPTLNQAPSSYPDAPHITTPFTGIDPTKDFTVAWDPFSVGTSLDFVQLHIDDDQGNKVFETPDYGKSGALLGTAVNAVVPANTLTAGRTYTARVVFQKNQVLDTTTYPGALGVASFVSRTTFNLVMSGGAAQSLSLSGRPSAGTFVLQIQGTPGSNVRVDRSADLHTWSPVSTNTVPTAGAVQVTDPQASGMGAAFYRATTVP